MKKLRRRDAADPRAVLCRKEMISMLYYVTLLLMFWALIYTSARFLQYFRIVKNYKEETTAAVEEVRNHEASGPKEPPALDILLSYEIGGEEKSSEAVSDQSGFFTPNEKIDFTGVKIEPLFADQVDFDTFSKSDFRAVKVKECSAVPKSKKLLKFVLDDGTGTDRVILSGIHAYYEPEELVGKTLIAITNLPPRAMMGIDSCGMLLSAVNERNGEEELHLLMVDNHIPAGAKLY